MTSTDTDKRIMQLVNWWSSVLFDS